MIGKLSVRDNTDDEWGQLIIEDEEGCCAAVIFNQEPGHPCSQERKDLARLLAAAPAMLDALREAREELIDLYTEAYPAEESDNDTTRVIDKVIAVIASATHGS